MCIVIVSNNIVINKKILSLQILFFELQQNNKICSIAIKIF